LYVYECALDVYIKMRAGMCFNAIYDIIKMRAGMCLNALYMVFLK